MLQAVFAERPGGGYPSLVLVNVKETSSDKEGQSYSFSYATLIQPNSAEDYARFIIYEPGYEKFADQQTNPYGPAEEQIFFSEETGKQEASDMRVQAIKGPELKR
jgi:hypothetical protein